MSSLRNAIRRRIHKERSQPKAREKVGFLEKRKDYKVRAEDYHRKEKAIKTLRTKAAFRNPDEFYFKMNSTKTQVSRNYYRVFVEWYAGNGYSCCRLGH